MLEIHLLCNSTSYQVDSAASPGDYLKSQTSQEKTQVINSYLQVIWKIVVYTNVKLSFLIHCPTILHTFQVSLKNWLVRKTKTGGVTHWQWPCLALFYFSSRRQRKWKGEAKRTKRKEMVWEQGRRRTRKLTISATHLDVIFSFSKQTLNYFFLNFQGLFGPCDG